jgi:hypothetical protein
LIEQDADEAAILLFCRSSEFLERHNPGLQGEA